MTAASMADSMPCCPHKPVPFDCQKCPMDVLCVANSQLGVQASVALPPLLSTDIVLAIQSDYLREGLGHIPPSRPPRTLV